MAHTKGEMIIYKEKYLEYFRSDGVQIRVADIVMPHRVDSIEDANDVLKRWNSHDDLLAACEKFIKKGWKAAYNDIEQAIAKTKL